MKKLFLYIIGTIVYYFSAVFVLFIMSSIFHAPFENIWFTAIKVTILAELLLLIYWFWEKSKKKQKYQK